MRKTIILLVLLCLGLSLAAQEADTTQVNFALLDAPVYNLNMRLAPEMQRIYIAADFTVEKAMLNEATYYSFFINKGARIEQLKINDVVSDMLLTTNLVPEHFNPVFTIPALLDSNAVVNCYSFKLDDIFLANGKAEFIIKYWIPLPEWHDSPEGVKCSGFLADQFWFPRNIEGKSTVNTKMVSTVSYNLTLGAECQFTEKDGIRTHQSSFQDSPDNFAPLKIIKG